MTSCDAFVGLEDLSKNTENPNKCSTHNGDETRCVASFMVRPEDHPTDPTLDHAPFTYSLCLYEEGRKGTFGETDASCYPDTEKVTCPGPPPRLRWTVDIVTAQFTLDEEIFAKNGVTFDANDFKQKLVAA